MSVDDDAGELVAVAVTRIEEGDFVRAYREVPVLRGIARGPLVLFPALAVLFGVCVSIMPNIARGAALGMTALVGLAMSGLAWWRSASLPRRQWRALSEWQRQNRYEVRRRRFRSRTEKTSNDHAYEEIFSWYSAARSIPPPPAPRDQAAAIVDR